MIRFSVKKPVTIFVAVVVILVLGVVAVRGMTPDLLPNMDFPYVIVITAYPGAAPEAVEDEVTRPIEASMATLDDIKSVSSSSSANMSMVVLEFQTDTDMNGIMVDMLSKLDSLKSGFSDMVQSPYILRINPSMLPAEVAAVEMEGMDIAQLSQFATDTLVPALEGVSGVASVTAYGQLEQQVEVFIREDMIEAVNNKLATAVNKELTEAGDELKDAQAELDNARTEVKDGKAALESAQNSTVEGLAEAAQLVDNAAAQSAAYSAQVTAMNVQKTALETEKSMIESGLAQAQDGAELIRTKAEELGQLRSAIAPLLTLELPAETPLAALEMLPQELLDSLAEQGCTTLGDVAALDETLAQTEQALAAQLAELETAAADAQTRLDEIQIELDNMNTEYMALQATNDAVQNAVSAALDNYASLEMGKMTAAVGFASTSAQLAAAETTMDSAQEQLDAAMEQYHDSVKTALDAANISDAVTLQTVAAILGAQDFSMPAGYIYDGGVGCIVSVGDEIGSVTELRNLMLFDLGMDDMEPIYLRDVAEVKLTDNADSIYARLNGETGLLLMVNKQSSYATASVCDNLKAEYADLEADNPGLHFVSIMNQGDYIYEIIGSIVSSLVWGAVFAVLVLLLFLRDIRPTFITLCSIPISLMFALVLMYFSGINLNLMSMSGLAISVGMLVDNSIVVIENTFRLRRLGESKIKAALSGAKQVAASVTASTVTTVCVFVPLAFSNGLTKQLFTDVALTLGYSLAASLLISLTLVPALACTTLHKLPKQRKGLLERLMPAYQSALRWSLRHKLVPLVLALVLLGVSAADVLNKGFAFLPSVESPQISVTIEMPEDTEFAEATELADEAMARIGEIEGVDTVAGMIAGDSALSFLSAGGNNVTCYVNMEPDTDVSSNAVVRQINERCADLDCTVIAENGSTMTSYTSMLGGSGVAVNVYANGLDELQEAANILASELAKVEGIAETGNGIDDPAPELHITVDKDKAMAEGLTVAQVYQQVALALTNEADSIAIRFSGLDHTVVVKTKEQEELTRKMLEELAIPVTDREGETHDVFLKDLVTMEESETLSTINRADQRRTLSVTGKLAEGYNVTRVTAAAEKQMQSVKLPEGVRYEFAGENETIMGAMEDLLLMLVVGMLLVYLVMVAQFQSMKEPFIVMFTIPLAFTGGLLGLIIFDMTLDILSMLGFVMLTGVIVNNGIVLVDYVNLLREDGMARRDAIVEACSTRMRPVLMTSLTTVMGLIVMALGRDESAMLMQPLAITCIGGLVYGTLMTLFIVPVIYDLLSRKKLRVVSEDDLELSEL